MLAALVLGVAWLAYINQRPDTFVSAEHTQAAATPDVAPRAIATLTNSVID